ncbi:MAG: hypothetical protein EOO16_12625 [Chitinophagaceae bacterium]|nr:MAG: hypothetical protein EOO16_12625 [Chitinophagaceae bacterium]
MTKNDCSLPPARSAVKRSANINDVIPGRPAGYRAQGSYVHPKQVAIDAKPVKFNAGTIGDDAKGMNFDPKRPDDDAKRIVFHPKSIDIDAKRTDAFCEDHGNRVPWRFA